MFKKYDMTRLLLCLVLLLSGCDLNYDSSPRNSQLQRERIKKMTGITDEDIDRKIKSDQRKALETLCKEMEVLE